MPSIASRNGRPSTSHRSCVHRITCWISASRPSSDAIHAPAAVCPPLAFTPGGKSHTAVPASCKSPIQPPVAGRPYRAPAASRRSARGAPCPPRGRPAALRPRRMPRSYLRADRRAASVRGAPGRDRTRPAPDRGRRWLGERLERVCAEPRGPYRYVPQSSARGRGSAVRAGQGRSSLDQGGPASVAGRSKYSWNGSSPAT